MNIKTATAKALSDIKAEHGLTLADIGARMEISPQAVGEYMRGDKHPSVGMFARFCQAMGAEPAEVLAEIMSTAEEEEMKARTTMRIVKEALTGCINRIATGAPETRYFVIAEPINETGICKEFATEEDAQRFIDGQA